MNNPPGRHSVRRLAEKEPVIARTKTSVLVSVLIGLVAVMLIALGLAPTAASATPDVMTVAAPAPMPVPAPAPAAAPAPQPSSSYTVVSGDTLSRIASPRGTTWQALWDLNRDKIADPNLIYVGEVIRLTGSVQLQTAAAVSSAPASAPIASSTAQKAVRVALAQVGKPYATAGAGPNSFDCSGLMQYAYRATGISLPHSAAQQFTLLRSQGKQVSRDQLQPGDLVFLGSPNIFHVGMYVGNGQVVYSPETGELVKVALLSGYFSTNNPVYARVV